MSRNKKPFSPPRPEPKKRTPTGVVIALAAAGGVVVGSAATHFLSRPVTPKPSVPSAVGGVPQAQTITMPPQQQFTPAPQPPGEPPPGKVWSVEHGHWHDAPIALNNSVPATATPTPATTVTPVPATVTPAITTTPPPAAAPAEKKE